MITELGHFALVMALCMTIFQSVFPIAGAARNNLVWMSLARPAARVQLLFIVIAFLSLVYAFVTNDFSVTYVAQNSNSLLPMVYRVCAVWGGHEGSLLLWVLILGFWTVAVTVFSHNLPEPFVARVIGVMGLVSMGFLLFMLFTSNPFERELFPPADGVDLNPLLQDPGLIIHPPVLYTGYVGFSVAFGFAIAALLGGKLDMTWARWSRPWTIVAWMFLTLGIALGSWWAYYELGWGGWWFWDPVENASFMPWLVGTALIHSLAATEKRGVFKNWTVLLAICAFSLSLLGTFLVRSGVLTSVHAFATDPARGVFILALLGIVIGGSLILYAWRAPGTFISSSYSLNSRETFLLANSALLTVAMGTVLLGTLYPLAIEVFGGKVSVGAPYFNSVFVPIMGLIVIILGIGVHTRWRSDSWKRLWQHLRFALLGSVTLAVLVAAMLGTNGTIETVLAVFLSGWILLSTVFLIRSRIRHQANIARGVAAIPRSFYGMCLAHIGLAITIVGVVVSSNYSSDLHTSMAPGDEEVLAGYTFRLDYLRTVDGPNYKATEAEINILRKGKSVSILHTQKRFYNVRDMAMTEAGIDGGLFRDLYVSLGEPLGNGRWSLRLYHKPYVRWIWLGALFMAFGGLLAVSDRRYRTVKQAVIEQQPDLSSGVSVKI
ncbi:MAG TPA: heme lyase CcmF/NrfE family subunit [Gammaproteobacteria bacterium]|nr:heme lyase CcmF/NrfE family subunit [Gammaproteobacteria bacterium]